MLLVGIDHMFLLVALSFHVPRAEPSYFADNPSGDRGGVFCAIAVDERFREFC
jgi:hypothetical protein